MKKILLLIFILTVNCIFALDLGLWRISAVHKINDTDFFILQEKDGNYRIFIKNGNNMSLEYLQASENKNGYLLLKGDKKDILLFNEKTQNIKNEKNKIIFINKFMIDTGKITELKETGIESIDISKKIEDDSIIVFFNKIINLDNNYYIGIKSAKNIYQVQLLNKEESDGKIYFKTADKKIIIMIDWNESGKAIGILNMDNKAYKIEAGFFNNTKNQNETE